MLASASSPAQSRPAAQRPLTGRDQRALYNPHPAPSGLLALEQKCMGTELSSEGLDARRRRLLFRAWHRGIKEMDLIMGALRRCRSGRLTDAEIDGFEALMEVPDQQIAGLGAGRRAAPIPNLTRRCSAVCATSTFEHRLMKPMPQSPADLLKPGQPLTLAHVVDGAEGLVIADLARAIAGAQGRAGDSLWWSAATARAWRSWRGRCVLCARLRCWNSRPGTACLTTACRPMPAWWRSA